MKTEIKKQLEIGFFFDYQELKDLSRFLKEEADPLFEQMFESASYILDTDEEVQEHIEFVERIEGIFLSMKRTLDMELS